MTEPAATELIDAKLAGLGDWRGQKLSHLRALIRRALPQVVETVKWRKPTNPNGVPVWEVDGILCTGEVYKTYVKLTFMTGASLPDPTGVFNAGFGGGARRAIDLKEGETVDEAAFIALIQAAAAYNTARTKPAKKA
ncbi:DUF1801 domain-containing protein [Brevundimonas sp.]|uniref:DUF1801 domain-containing protein n=1 Tax=Brevundimonas sp. TaxID=1871086 RepID=UPI00286B2352|nr:DUF1801 domain-containing protein [Brevundimonas sp.]